MNFNLELPRSFYLETTSRCNSLCKTCILTYGGREPKNDLSLDGFLHIVKQFPKIERAVMHGIGEPLLNISLPAMISFLKNQNSQVIFNSNAISLSHEKSVALIGSGLDELRVSLDAATEKTYEKIRGVPSFNKVIENLKRLNREKQKQNVLYPKVSLWFSFARAY